MSYQSEADNAKNQLTKNINDAVSWGSKFLDPNTPGAYEYEAEYMEKIQEAFLLLLKVKQLVK